MIGTIRPSWHNLKCLGLRDFVAHSMCRACGSLATERTNLSRALLSYDTIFLSLFSNDSGFTEQTLRLRPFRCGTRFVEQSMDGNYLANISILTAATKIQDDITDGQRRLPGFMRDRIENEKSLAAQKLATSGLPIHEIASSLAEYSETEVRRINAPFSEISHPIEHCYGLVFGNLPSRKNESEPMEQIGRVFGRLTLLVDSVEDSEQDQKTGRFNVWHASTDLPNERTSLLDLIATEFNHLKSAAAKISKAAEQYAGATRDAVMQRLSGRRKSEMLMTHPTARLGSIACFEQNCDGSYSLTDSGMCIAAICGIGCIVCCAKD